jgi:hypothetical protein
MSGFGLSMLEAVLSGHGSELIELATTDMFH